MILSIAHMLLKTLRGFILKNKKIEIEIKKTKYIIEEFFHGRKKINEIVAKQIKKNDRA